MAELVVTMTHSPEVTHFDALAHQVVDGKVYPGLALEEAGGPAGLRHGSTAVFAHGVVTRGDLYAKLDSHHRAEALARARDLGLLAPSAWR
jgi:hypothetical protein